MAIINTATGGITSWKLKKAESPADHIENGTMHLFKFVCKVANIIFSSFGIKAAMNAALIQRQFNTIVEKSELSKKSLIFLTVLLLCFFPSIAQARDYVVELFEEHYQEQMIVGGGESKIYHAWQVKTIFGNKLLVLIGDDQGYRNWLRKYADNHRLFLVKIPGNGDERFKYDRAVLLNVQQVHAIWDQKWLCEGCRHGQPPPEPMPTTP